MKKENIWIEITFTAEEDDGTRYAIDSLEPFETFTADRRALFNDLQCEYGPCRGSIYLDKENGDTLRVGWVFEKRRKFDGSKKCFTQITWVTVVTPDKHRVMVPQYIHIPVML